MATPRLLSGAIIGEERKKKQQLSEIGSMERGEAPESEKRR
jgi:hypothetical protein